MFKKQKNNTQKKHWGLKILIALILVLAFSSYLLQINKSTESDADLELKPGAKLKVASTIFPIHDLVKQVGGEEVEAILLLSPGASPHTFEASPEQVKSLVNTKLLLSIGATLDDWVLSLEANAPEATLIDLSEKVNLRFLSENSADPHYWLSPDNARLLTLSIADILSDFSPEKASYFKERASNFIELLSERELSWREELKNLENRDLIVFHDAWYYFADYFNFNILASFEEFPGKSPSPKYLANLEAKIKELAKPLIFIEPQLSPVVVEALAQDLSAQIFTLDPLGGVEGRLSYLDLLTYNINTLAQALGQ